MTEISVDDGNPNYASRDGVLYSKDKKALLLCPGGKSGAFSIPEDVTAIGDGAFTDCDSLISIQIPVSVGSIGDEAFLGCEELTEIDVNENNAQYAGKNGILYSKDGKTLICCPSGKTGTVSVPDCVTQIAEEAFCWCGKLQSVTFGENSELQSIGESAFEDCINLTNITIPNGVGTIENSTFGYCRDLTCIEIPASVTSVDDMAFCSCKNLKSAALPSSASFCDNVFDDCPNLSNFYILGDSAPSELPSVPNTFLFAENGTGGYKNTGYSGTKIGMLIPKTLYGKDISPAIDPASLNGTETTAYCDGTNLYSDSHCQSGSECNDDLRSQITNIEFKTGVTSIGSGVFHDCVSVTNITIPSSVTSIDNNVFMDCTNLTEINVYGGNSDFESRDGVLYSKDGKTLVCCPCGRSGVFSIPADSDIESIGMNAFASCTGLTSVTVPDSVTSIGDYAFSGCTTLIGISISKAASTIGDGAFSDCFALTSVAIPASVTSIGNGAFINCADLTYVILKRTVEPITSIGGDAFAGDSLTCLVPALRLSEYTGELQGTNTVVVAEKDVTAIANLPKAQTVPNGTTLADLKLPSSLNLTINGQQESVAVTWASTPEYDPSRADTYTFTPVLPIEQGYLLADGFAPQVAVTVNGPRPTVSGVTVFPSTATVQRGASCTFSAIVGGTNSPSQTVTWTVAGNKSQSTAIDKGGKLTVVTDETAATLTVKAISVSDVSKYGTAVVTVTGSGNNSGHSSSSTTSTPSHPAAIIESQTGAQADLSGATLPSGVTGVSLAVTPETASGVPTGTAGGTADAQGAAAYNFAVSNTALNVIGTPILYNIKLLDQNGNPITSFTGSVTVRIPVPAGIHGTPHVFRYEENTGTLTDLGATVQNGFLVFTTSHFSYYVIAGTGDSIMLDTKGYLMPVNGKYQIGVKLTGSKAASVKVTSTNDKVAAAARLKNGNVQVTGKGVGTAYIMIDVYDSKNHLLTHASVKIDVKTGIRPRGDSARQIGVF